MRSPSTTQVHNAEYRKIVDENKWNFQQSLAQKRRIEQNKVQESIRDIQNKETGHRIENQAFPPFDTNSGVVVKDDKDIEQDNDDIYDDDEDVEDVTEDVITTTVVETTNGTKNIKPVEELANKTVEIPKFNNASVSKKSTTFAPKPKFESKWIINQTMLLKLFNETKLGFNKTMLLKLYNQSKMGVNETTLIKVFNLTREQLQLFQDKTKAMYKYNLAAMNGTLGRVSAQLINITNEAKRNKSIGAMLDQAKNLTNEFNKHSEVVLDAAKNLTEQINTKSLNDTKVMLGNLRKEALRMKEEMDVIQSKNISQVDLAKMKVFMQNITQISKNLDSLLTFKGNKRLPFT